MSKIMTYRQAVAEAKTLAKRSEADQWRLAELTWTQVRPQGTATTRQWGDDIGLSFSYVGKLARIWERHRVTPGHKRPSFTAALDEVKGIPQGERRPFEAVQTIKAMEPEKRAEVVRALVRAEPSLAAEVIRSEPKVARAVAADRQAQDAQWRQSPHRERLEAKDERRDQQASDRRDIFDDQPEAKELASLIDRYRKDLDQRELTGDWVISHKFSPEAKAFLIRRLDLAIADERALQARLGMRIVKERSA